VLNANFVAWRSLWRVLAQTAGRAALQRALPLYLAVVLGAAIIFGRNGLSPATIAASCSSSRSFRVAIYATWALASLPAIKALLATEASFFLRTLPVPRARMFTVNAVFLVGAELPWIALWLAAAGPIAASAAALTTLSLSCLALCQLERRAALAAACLCLALLFAPSPLGLLVVAAPCAVFGVGEVWLRAPELPSRRARAWVRGPAVLALTLSYLVVLRRRASAQLLRAAGFSLIAVGVGFVVINNRGYVSEGELRVAMLITLVPPLALGVTGIAGPILRTESELGWLTSACGTPWLTRQSAALLAASTISFVLTVTLSLSLALLLPIPNAERAVIVGQAALATGLLTPLVLSVARWAVRDTGRDGMRLLAGIGGGCIVTLFSLAMFGTRALLLWFPFTIIAGFRRASDGLSRGLGDSAPRPQSAKGDSIC